LGAHAGGAVVVGGTWLASGKALNEDTGVGCAWGPVIRAAFVIIGRALPTVVVPGPGRALGRLSNWAAVRAEAALVWAPVGAEDALSISGGGGVAL
jgi:hypothetical protein